MTLLDERPTPATTSPANSARRAMIDSQLRVSGVNDPAVLAAMDVVAREDFVPEAQKAHAYIDRALPLGDGASLPAPLVQGRILTEAAIQSGEKVMVISASGYLAALVTVLGGDVTTLAPAAAASRKKGAAFDLVLVDGAAEVLPSPVAAMLADNGRLVTGLIERGVTRLAVGTRSGEGLALLPVADIGMPAIAEFAAPKRWSF